MNQEIKGLLIREEKEDERGMTEALIREAFWNRYKPGCDEHFLMHRIRQAKDFQPWHSLVALYEGTLIGQVALTPARIVGDYGTGLDMMIVGPLGVLPACSLRGIGSALMNSAIETAKSHGVPALFLMGDPRYYRRFGFVPASMFSVFLPGADRQDEAAFFMALPLVDKALDNAAGHLRLSPVFDDLQTGLKEYDSAFLPREKLRLPGQFG